MTIIDEIERRAVLEVDSLMDSVYSGPDDTTYTTCRKLVKKKVSDSMPETPDRLDQKNPFKK